MQLTSSGWSCSHVIDMGQRPFNFNKSTLSLHYIIYPCIIDQNGRRYMPPPYGIKFRTSREGEDRARHDRTEQVHPPRILLSASRLALITRPSSN